jgi:lia operon protein LiaG
MNSKEKFNIKKLATYLLGVMLVSYLIGGLTIFAAGGNIFKNSKSSIHLDDMKKSNLTGVREIKIDTSSEQINIIQAGTNEIRAHLNGSITSTSKYTKPELQITRSGDTLNIKVITHTHVTFGFFSSDIKLDVYIPAVYSKKLEILATSGDIKISDYKLEGFKIHLSSGNIEANNLSADAFECLCTSGNVVINGLKTKTANFEASSGNINVNGFSGDLKSDTTSGDVNYEYEQFSNNVEIEVSSGQIELKLPKVSQFNLDANATSGNVTCDFPIIITSGHKENVLVGHVGSSTNNIKLDATSGDITCLSK